MYNYFIANEVVCSFRSCPYMCTYFFFSLLFDFIVIFRGQCLSWPLKFQFQQCFTFSQEKVLLDTSFRLSKENDRCFNFWWTRSMYKMECCSKFTLSEFMLLEFKITSQIHAKTVDWEIGVLNMNNQAFEYFVQEWLTVNIEIYFFFFS